MSTHDYTQKISELINNVMYGDTCKPDDLQVRINSDMGMDSLDTIELVMDLEEEYDLDITDEDIVNLGDPTLQELVDFIKLRCPEH